MITEHEERSSALVDLVFTRAENTPESSGNLFEKVANESTNTLKENVLTLQQQLI